MRIEYGTLDHLGPADFQRTAVRAAADVRLDLKLAEEVARSYGL